MNIGMLCGSLRKDSYNRKLMEYAQQYAPEEMKLREIEINDLPFFNQDLETDPAEAVIKFRNEIEKTQGILFVTPEYNNSIPGVLKNAIEWGSRPYGKSVLNGKPMTMMGGSSGMLGTVRAQYQLRQIAVQVNMFTMNKPEVMVPFIQEVFDESGKLSSSKT